MITVINTFIVPDEAMDPFIAEFELHRDFLARQPGFVRGSLYRKANGPGVFNVINLAVWQSEDELQAARAKMGALYAARGVRPDTVYAQLGVKAEYASFDEVQTY